MRPVGVALVLVAGGLTVVAVAGTASASGATAAAVSEGATATCAVSAGQTYCWGHDNYGQLGGGTATPGPHELPVDVVTAAGVGPLSTVTGISAGPTNSTCAVSAAHAYCWGLGSSGQLGDGTTTSSATPVEVLGVGGSGVLSTVSAISAGTFTTCAVISGRNVVCWGSNDDGQLGDGTTTSSSTPVEVRGEAGTGALGTTVAVYGATADATAAAELTLAFPYTEGECPPTRAAVVATTSTYEDALSSQFLAQSLTTGTLLTPTTRLSPVTAATLEDEGISTVDIVGGPLAVSSAVQAAIEALPADECGGVTPTGTISVQRIYGQTAYGTAAAIAEHVGTAPALSFPGAYGTTDATGGRGLYNDTSGEGSAAPVGSLRTAILASGQEFHDAQAASVISYHTAVPLLLTPGTSLPATALGAFRDLGIDQVIVVGGPYAVSNSIEASLAATGDSVLRVAGADYAGTAVELARFEAAGATAGLGWTPGHRVMVARGDGFTDGIAGAVLDNARNASTGTGDARPLLLTTGPTTVGPSLAAFLQQAGRTGIGGTPAKTVTALTVLGGPLAVSTTAIIAMEHDLAT